MARPPGAVALLVVLAVVGATVPVGATPVAAPGPGDGVTAATPPVAGADAAADGGTIELTEELRLTPDRPGEIEVQLRFSIPDAVDTLRTRVPSEATVTATRGFDRDGGAYAWDGATATPRVTFRMPANETRESSGPIAGAGDYRFVDAGEWALVAVPGTRTRWRSFEPTDLDRTVTTAGPGAAGDALAYLGEHAERVRTAHGQTFRLVVPARADLAAPPDEVFGTVTAASGRLRVGDRDETVFMVAAPTGDVPWSVRGIQVGDADLWVRDTATAGTVDNVWVHEYVHTRQDYTPDRGVRWFTEGSATYFAALLTLEQGRIDFGTFREHLAAGTQGSTGAVLADSDTWTAGTPYFKGALVAGELDRRIRLATDGRRTLGAVLRRLNGRDGPVTRTAFVDAVREVAGDDAAAVADRYTSTTDTPAVWNATAHERAFGTPVALMEVALADPAAGTGYRVEGPYRNGSVGGEPIRLAAGETLAVDATVTNTGGAPGEYDARLFVDGRLRGQETGSLAANASTTVTFTRTFEDTGEFTLRVGDDRTRVVVESPREPAVTGLRVADGPTRPNGTVSLVATVRNEGSVPAAGDLTLSADGDAVETRRVALAPGESRRVEFDAALAGPGDYRFELGGEAVRVSVTPTPSPAPAPTVTATRGRTAGGGDGFGVAPALAALGALLALGAAAGGRGGRSD